MATSKGWNSLTPKQQADFKAKNFNMKVKVTESQLDKLRKEGTPTKAIAKYKNDASMREALNRFYGKDRVAKAIGTKTRGYTNADLAKAKAKKTTPVKPKVAPTKPSSTKSSAKKDPRAEAGKQWARGPISGQATTSNLANKARTNPNERAKQDDIAGKILLVASAVPAVRAARTGVAVVRGVKGIMNAKKVGAVAGKRAKPSTVRSTVKDVMGAGSKKTGKYAAPKSASKEKPVKSSSAGKRAKPASTPRRAAPTTLRGTVTRTVKSVTSRSTGGRRAKPSVSPRHAKSTKKGMK
jgi:hypothetical protein